MSDDFLPVPAPELNDPFESGPGAPGESAASGGTGVPAPRRPTGQGWVAPGTAGHGDDGWSAPPGPPQWAPPVPPSSPYGPAPPFAPGPVYGQGPPQWGQAPQYGQGPPQWGPTLPYGAATYGPGPYGQAPYGYGLPWGVTPVPFDPAGWMAFDPDKPAPRWGMPDILLGLIAFIVASLVFTIPAIMLVSETGIISIIGLAGSWVGMVGYLYYVSRKKGQGTFRDDFGFRFKLFDPLLGFGMGILTLILAGITSTIVANLFSAEPGNNADRIFEDKSSAVIVVVTALMAAVGAPITEELFFRGLTLRSIERRLGSTAGILGSALVFGVLHWQPGPAGSTASLVSAIAVYGLVFAIITRWQARLGPAIFAHMTINSIAAGFTLYSYFSGTPPV